ncbi:MAG: hypothetical protein JSR18_08305, partial [Proteobacteria bacterium]|nr:hypothetical protein [Pseudomonadota bacterium]
MPLDSNTQVTRTAAGVDELSKPTHGLSLGQRKLLTFLDTPCTFGALLGANPLDPDKAERDLAKLRELRLVDYAGPPRAAAAQGPATVSQLPGAPVVLGGRRSGSPLRWIGIAVVALVAVGAWLALKPQGAAPAPQVADVQPPPAPAPAPATVAAAPAPAVTAPVAPVLPVAATMLGDTKETRKADAKEVREVRPEPEPARPEVKLSAADIARLAGNGSAAPAPNLGTPP